jgi:hypothetical protein
MFHACIERTCALVEAGYEYVMEFRGEGNKILRKGE